MPGSFSGRRLEHGLNVRLQFLGCGEKSVEWCSAQVSRDNDGAGWQR